MISLLYKLDLTLSSAGGEIRDQADERARFAAIVFDNISGQFVFSARRWNNLTSSYVCQLYQGLSNHETQLVWSGSITFTQIPIIWRKKIVKIGPV